MDNLSKSAVTDHGKKHARKIHGDESPEQAIAIFKAVMNTLLPKTADFCDLYIFTSYQVLERWLVMCDEFLAPFGFEREALCVWVKDGPGMGDLRVPFGMGCEFIMMYRKGISELKVKRRNSVLHHPQVLARNLIHPHEKPTGLLKDFIRASTDPGDFLVDPFGGSASLARAARELGDRSCVCIEYDKENFDLATKAFNEGQGVGLFG